MLETNWRDNPVKNVTEYVILERHKRYGFSDLDTNVAQAWTEFVNSTYAQDLSVQDPTSIFNLFGLLPYSTSFLPDFLNIGIWPLLMGVTMFLQQRLNPTPPDPIQAKIFAWMPVAFTFLLATFPAGLVIYWTWNNLLSICQQWVIMNKMNKESK